MFPDVWWCVAVLSVKWMMWCQLCGGMQFVLPLSVLSVLFLAVLRDFRMSCLCVSVLQGVGGVVQEGSLAGIWLHLPVNRAAVGNGSSVTVHRAALSAFWNYHWNIQCVMTCFWVTHTNMRVGHIPEHILGCIQHTFRVFDRWDLNLKHSLAQLVFCFFGRHCCVIWLNN